MLSARSVKICSHGIEPNFNLWSPGAGCITIITYNVLNQIKKERIQDKNQFHAYN